jgi:hypothetical protein
MSAVKHIMFSLAAVGNFQKVADRLYELGAEGVDQLYRDTNSVELASRCYVQVNEICHDAILDELKSSSDVCDIMIPAQRVVRKSV